MDRTTEPAAAVGVRACGLVRAAGAVWGAARARFMADSIRVAVQPSQSRSHKKKQNNERASGAPIEKDARPDERGDNRRAACFPQSHPSLNADG